MGGGGVGRGGESRSNPNDRPTEIAPIPGQPGPDGDALLIGRVRGLPSADEDPQTYEQLRREAASAAEEALRRGDVPRRYRGYVRRFFSGPEDE